MDLNRWPHLTSLLEAAKDLQSLEVWLFGSALRSDSPADLDVLLVYEDRSAVVALRSVNCWEEHHPPFHIIAMTPQEVDEYAFIKTTRAVRLI